MKGYYDEFGTLKNIIIFMVLAMGFIGITQVTGHLTITVTGQPTIDLLNYELSTCQAELDTKCDPCPEFKCMESNPFPEFGVGLLFGIIVGYIYFLWFGEDTRKWMIRRLKKKSEGL